MVKARSSGHSSHARRIRVRVIVGVGRAWWNSEGRLRRQLWRRRSTARWPVKPWTFRRVRQLRDGFREGNGKLIDHSEELSGLSWSGLAPCSPPRRSGGCARLRTALLSECRFGEAAACSRIAIRSSKPKPGNVGGRRDRRAHPTTPCSTGVG